MADAAMTPWVTRFGDDPDTWNLGDDDPDGEEGGECTGLPGINCVANAVGTWRQILGEPLLVERVALVMNLPADLAGLALETAPKVMRYTNGEAVEVSNDELADLLMTWIALRGREASVAEAATTFDVHATRVMEAAGAGLWLYLCGDRDDLTNLMIGCDGE